MGAFIAQNYRPCSIVEFKIHIIPHKELKEAAMSIYKQNPTEWDTKGFTALYRAATLVFCVE